MDAQYSHAGCAHSQSLDDLVAPVNKLRSVTLADNWVEEVGEAQNLFFGYLIGRERPHQ